VTSMQIIVATLALSLFSGPAVAALSADPRPAVDCRQVRALVDRVGVETAELMASARGLSRSRIARIKRECRIA
jgi:hypothetical protein